jgi:hypothetical protein
MTRGCYRARRQVYLCSLIVKSGPFAGFRLRDLLALADRVLGGTISALPPNATVPDLTNALDAANNNFDDCAGNAGFLARP